MKSQSSGSGKNNTQDGELSQLFELLGVYDESTQETPPFSEYGVSLQSEVVHDSVVCCVKYSWDGRYVASACNAAAKVFDAEHGAELVTLSKPYDVERGEACYIRSVCFTPDNESLVTGGEDHIVKIWDLQTASISHQLVGHTEDVCAVDVGSNGRFMVSASATGAYVWDLATAKLNRVICTEDILSISISPTCRFIAGSCVDGSVFLWDTESSMAVRKLDVHRERVYSVAFSPCEKLLVSASIDKKLVVHDIRSLFGTVSSLTLTGHLDYVLAASYSHCGNWIFSSSKDRTVRRWDMRNPTTSLTCQGHNGSIISISSSPTHHAYATGCADRHVRTWFYDSNHDYYSDADTRVHHILRDV